MNHADQFRQTPLDSDPVLPDAGGDILSDPQASGSVSELAEALQPLQTIQELVSAGGPVVAILLGVSVIALTVAVAKAIQLRAAIRPPAKRLAGAFQAYARGSVEEAQDLFEAIPGATAHLCAVAVRGKKKRQEMDSLREQVSVAARGSVADMRSHLRILEVISQVAPLLGLLGTILGMIDVFQTLESAGDTVRPSALAGGIWVALLTTATGLAVSIPATLCVQWFDGVIEREIVAIETGVTAIMTDQALPEAVQAVAANNVTRLKHAVPAAGE